MKCQECGQEVKRSKDYPFEYIEWPGKGTPPVLSKWRINFSGHRVRRVVFWKKNGKKYGPRRTR